MYVCMYVCIELRPPQKQYIIAKSLSELIGLVGRVFANRPGDVGSIPGRVIPETLKMVLDTSLLNTQQYKVRIKGKVEQSRERCSSYWKGSILVAFDYGCQLYFYQSNTVIRFKLSE